MSRFFPLGTVCLLASILIAGPAAAGDWRPGFDVGRHSNQWEVRGGVADYDAGPFTSQFGNGPIVNAELFAASPAFLDIIGSPRPYFGADIATDDTQTNVVYAGLNWQAHLYERFYLGFSAGGAVLEDQLIGDGSGRAKDLGSDVLFHLQASAGFDFTPDLSAEIYLNHVSNAGLEDANSGLESTGIRLGYRF
jgi:hypothetical protein